MGRSQTATAADTDPGTGRWAPTHVIQRRMQLLHGQIGIRSLPKGSLPRQIGTMSYRQLGTSRGLLGTSGLIVRISLGRLSLGRFLLGGSVDSASPLSSPYKPT